MKSYIQLVNSIKDKIINRYYGKSGERFYSIRQLCEMEKISYKVSYKILNELQNLHLIILIDKIWYLSFGLANKNSNIRKIENEKIIGIHIKEIDNPYINSITGILIKELNKINYKVIIESSENNYHQELNILRDFIKIGCSGVINFPSSTNLLNDFYKYYPLPLSFIGRIINISSSLTMPSVLTDNYQISKNVAKHLIEKGYKNLFYLGIPTLPDADNERLQGFIDGINLLSKFNNNNLIKINQNNDYEFKQFCKLLLENLSSKNPIAVFCVNDLYAAKLLYNLSSLDSKIPTLIGIFGYDDLPICKYLKPTLSTVSYSYELIAINSIKQLLSISCSNPQKNNNIYVPNSLIIRKSCL